MTIAPRHRQARGHGKDEDSEGPPSSFVVLVKGLIALR